MKKGLKIFLCIALALVLAGAGLWIWQRNNIDALRKSVKLSSEELTEQMQQQASNVADTAQKAGVTVRDLTDEEKEALYTGQLSRGDLIHRISGNETPEASDPQPPEEPTQTDAPDTAKPSPEPAAPPETTPAAPSASSETPAVQPEPDANAQARSQLAACMAEIYVMQAEYNDWLEKANQSAIDDFNALPEEQRTATSKFSIGLNYANEALKKEKECDASMKALETQIRALLEQLGEDTALVDEIHNTYLEEKALKKAYYLGLH